MLRQMHQLESRKLVSTDSHGFRWVSLNDFVFNAFLALISTFHALTFKMLVHFYIAWPQHAHCLQQHTTLQTFNFRFLRAFCVHGYMRLLDGTIYWFHYTFMIQPSRFVLFSNVQATICFLLFQTHCNFMFAQMWFAYEKSGLQFCAASVCDLPKCACF